jgi:hypothetical protein
MVVTAEGRLFIRTRVASLAEARSTAPDVFSTFARPTVASSGSGNKTTSARLFGAHALPDSATTDARRSVGQNLLI